MARILITGSTDGVGRNTAQALVDDGHDVVVHARSTARLSAVQDLLDHVHGLIEQARTLGPIDTVIHHAGVMQGPVLPVNVTAPYLMTALIPASRHIYLSSSMHRSGSPDLAGVDWTGTAETHSYSDAKLFVTVLMSAVARQVSEMLAHAVDPGWVPTKMGGAGASDDLTLAHVTQAWLATTDDADALVSGRYWHHRRTEQPHPAVHDAAFQDRLLASLAEQTGVALAPPASKESR